jgi:hypothetical protein
MDLRLELVSVPVADVDRAKAFYVDQVGFSVEQDVQVDENHRFVELMPPGSPCSIALTTGYIDSKPGSLKERSSTSKVSMRCTRSYVIMMLTCPRSRTTPGVVSAFSPIPMATVGQSTARCVRSSLPRFYRTSAAESGSGVCRLANAPGRRHSSQAATNTVSTTAASWVMLPASAPSSKESTRAPLLLLASKI